MLAFLIQLCHTTIQPGISHEERANVGGCCVSVCFNCFNKLLLVRFDCVLQSRYCPFLPKSDHSPSLASSIKSKTNNKIPSPNLNTVVMVLDK